MKRPKTDPVQYHYDKFPPEKLDWEQLLPLIGPANRALAKFDGILSVVPNAEVLLTPLTTQEAVLSSRIEGTQANLDEVLEYEAVGESKDLTEKKKKEIRGHDTYFLAVRIGSG